MKKSTLFVNAFIVSILLVLFSINVVAQPATKDENIHRDPMVMTPGYTAPGVKESMATVITIGDYDNFKLGVDFAECSITNNPLNPLQYYAVWNSITTSGGKGYSTSNGFDWTASNPGWTSMAGDVVVTYDSSGRLAYQNMYGSISGAKVAMSSNNGLTWGAPVIAITGNDKNWIAADQTNGPYSNYLISTMTNNGTGAISLSSNHGVAWSPTASLTTQSLPGMSVCIGPKNGISGGAQYIVTNSGSSFASNYTFYESGDGGQTYTYKSAQQFANYVGTNVGGRNSVQNMRTRPYPNIAADNSYGPHRGRLYLVYASNSPAGSGNKPDIFCRYSDDGASTWSSATVVNDDPTPQAHHNWFPAIWCEKQTGRLYISWMDTRDCPTSDSAMIYASYTDDGVTFAANQRISNKKMKINCTSCGGGGTPAYEGDYNGIAANPVGAMLAWTDFRDGNFANYVGYFPDFGLKATPAIDTLSPTATFYLKVPSVKLYTDTVIVSATISGAPGLFTISFPQGNKLWSYPGEVPILVTPNGTTPIGDYTITIVAQGSNGTPVHKRTAIIRSYTFIAPLADFTANKTSVCAGKSVNFSDLSVGPPTNWSWSFPGGTPSSSNVQNPSNIVYNTPGNYDVTLTATNSIGTDTKLKSGYITVNDVPAQPESSNMIACEGDVIPSLTATGQNVAWHSDAALTHEVALGNTFATGQILPGTYTYYVTQSANGCESSATVVTLTINALPVVTLAPFNSVCISSPSIDLTGGEPVGGLYSGTGVNANGLVFEPQVAGPGTFILSYIFTSALGCTDTAYQSITVNAIPTVTMEPIAPVCANALAFQLSGGLPLGGSYSGNGVTGDIFDPTIAGAGIYAISYTYTVDTTGCQNSATTDITVNTIPVAPSTSDLSACEGNPVPDLTSTGINLKWYSDTALTQVVFQGDPFATGQTIPGTYTYYVTQSDNGCESPSTMVTLTINVLPAVTLQPYNAVCANSPAFNLTGGYPAGGLYSGNGVNGNIFDPAIAGAGTTTVTYAYTVSTTGCENAATTDIPVNAIPALELGSDVNSCAHLSVILDATTTNAINYLWFPGGNTTATISVDSTGIGVGNKMFYVAVSDLNNCSVKDSVKVFFHDCTGIEEQGHKVHINLYPNPSTGIVTLQSDGISNTTVSINIYTATDKLILDNKQIKVTGSLNKTLNLNNLANGFYLLKIQDDQKSWTKRFVIQK